MRSDQTRSPARLLAPLALAACAVALILVVATSGGGEDGGGGESAASRTEATTTTARGGRRPTPASYTVRTGDTLGAIAVRTGVPVDRLQQLNPELDPQALVSGQRIKLR